MNPLSNGQKFRIYVLSFVLTPMGLYWFFKNFRSPIPGNRKAGYIALILTTAALAGSLYVSYRYIEVLTDYTDLYEQQLNLYEGL